MGEWGSGGAGIRHGSLQVPLDLLGGTCVCLRVCVCVCFSVTISAPRPTPHVTVIVRVCYQRVAARMGADAHMTTPRNDQKLPQ